MKLLLIADLHSDDKYTEERIEKSLKKNPDAVILLGDIKSTDLYLITNSFKCPILGITGDDDAPNTLDKYQSIENIDGTITNIGDLKIGGFAGSLRYKRGMFSMRTQDEAHQILKYTPPCDIFVSHETGRNYMSMYHSEIERIKRLEREKYEASQKKFEEEKRGIFSKFSSIFRKKDEDDEEEFSDVRNSIITEKALEDTMYDGFDAVDDYIKRVNPKVHLFGHHHIRKHFDKYNTTCGCVYLFEMLELSNGTINLSPIESDKEKIEKEQMYNKADED